MAKLAAVALSLIAPIVARGAEAPIPNVSPRQTAPLPPPRGSVAPAPSGAAVFAKAAPSVVLIECVRGDRGQLGAGSILDGDGTILTNAHVIEDAERCFAVLKPAGNGVLNNKTPTYALDLVAVDATKDLALVRLSQQPGALPPLDLGSMSDLQVGQDVHAIGHPIGNFWSYTRGVVSQVRPQFRMKSAFVADVVQTQTPISHGNSGGPLLDDHCRLVGVNTFGQEDGQNLNFAVAVSEVKAFIERVSHGHHGFPPSPRRTSPPVAQGGGSSGGKEGGGTGSGGGECPPKKLREARSTRADKPGTVLWLELACAGYQNAELQVPDEESKDLVLHTASRQAEPGEKLLYDTRYYIDRKTGNVRLSFHDVDRDGHFDYEGVYREGATTPYRFIPYSAAANY